MNMANGIDNETLEVLARMGVAPKYLELMNLKDVAPTTAGLPGLAMYKDATLAGTGFGGRMYGGPYSGKEEIKNRGLSQSLFLNPKSPNIQDSIAHETEHLLARQNLGHPFNINKKFDELIGDTNTRQQFVSNAVAAAPHLEKKYGMNSAYFQPEFYKEQGAAAPNLLYEQFAVLAALEQRHKVDLTKDPVLRKTLFKDPAVREAYNAMTGLRQTRLDPRDLPPYTRQPEPGLAAKTKKMLGMNKGGAIDKAITGGQKFI
jgi:hypothetical protein